MISLCRCPIPESLLCDMGMLQPFQDCGAIIREIAGWVKRILDMPAMFVWYFKEENTLRFWRLCGTVEGIGGQPVCRHGAAYRLGTGRKTSCGGSAEQHWKPSFAYIDRSNRYNLDGKEEKPAHPCAGGFQPGFCRTVHDSSGTVFYDR